MAQPRLLVCVLLAVAARASPVRMKSSVVECDARQAMVGVATTHLTTAMKASDITCMPHHATARPGATNLTCDQPFTFVQSISYQVRPASVCTCYAFDACLVPIAPLERHILHPSPSPGHGRAHQAGNTNGHSATHFDGMQRIRRQAHHQAPRRRHCRDCQLPTWLLCPRCPPLHHRRARQRAHRGWYVDSTCFTVLLQCTFTHLTDVSLAVDCTEADFDADRFGAQADWLQTTYASSQADTIALDTTPRAVHGMAHFSLEQNTCVHSTHPGSPCDEACSECNHQAHRCMRCSAGYFLPESSTTCGARPCFF